MRENPEVGDRRTPPRTSTSSNAGTALTGQYFPAPRRMWVTTLLAVVGWLAVAHLARVAARLVLAFRQPVELTRSPAGIIVRSRTEVLGRLLRDTETVIPRNGLVRATRDIRYPSLPTYVGLLSLALGSYFGAGLVVDGIRVAAASLFELGALVVLVGLGLDFLLASLLPGSRGRCRVILVPQRGPVICIGEVEVAAADAFLGQLANDAEPRAELASAGTRSLSARPKTRVAEATELPAEPPKQDSAGETG